MAGTAGCVGVAASHLAIRYGLDAVEDGDNEPLAPLEAGSNLQNDGAMNEVSS